ncbi:hypothetical protein ACFL55_01275 [Candidatus Latescibacterota bacterium]
MDNITLALIASIALIFLILAIIFKNEIKQFVNWITSFKKIQKTKEGYSFEGSSEPSKPAMLESTDTNELQQIGIEEKNGGDNSTDSWLRLFIEKKYDESLSVIESLINNTDDEDEILLFESVKGFVLFEKDYKEGTTYFEELIRNNPQSVKAYIWYAYSYGLANNYTKSLEIIDRGLNIVTNKSPLITLKTTHLERKGDNDELIKEILESSIKDGTADDVQYQKLCELSKDNPEYAYNLYVKSIKQFPMSITLRENFAEFLDAHEKQDEALLQRNELHKMEPDNFTYMTLLGNSYLDNGLNDKALEMYKNANSKAQGKEGWILANIGNIYKNQGFFSEAMSYLNKAISIVPNSVYSHERLAESLKFKEEEENKFSEILNDARIKLSNSSWAG